MVRRIAIQHPYTGVAEDESCARITAAAAALGIEARAFRNSQDMVDFSPDFVLSLAHQDPKLTPLPTYGVMTAPVKWYETPRFIRNILTYDGYLTVTPGTKEWLGDLCFGARKKNTPIGFYANTAPLMEGLASPDFPSPDFAAAKLAYIGTNWDGPRHRALFHALGKTGFMAFHGPEDAWADYGQAYAGALAFDGSAVLEAYTKAGVGLCIEHPDFAAEGVPTNRIFETLASGALAICSRTAFHTRWFGDTLLYIDDRREPAAIAAEIAAHMAWVHTNPEAAAAKAAAAHQIYRKHFALETMVKALVDFHAKCLTQKGYVPSPEAGSQPKVGVIMRAGGRGKKFLERSVGSVAHQSHAHKKLYIAEWDTAPGLETVLEDHPGLAAERISVPGGGRSDCLWAGIGAAKADGCDLIGILDDDDEYHPNMMACLVAGYAYHQSLSLSDPITMVTGGSLICFEDPVQHYFEDMTDDVHLPRAEKRFIKQFHFPSRGQVSDWSFVVSPSAMLMAADYFDTEIMENPGLDVAEDYYLWLMLAERGRAAFVPEIVSTVHEHSEGQSDYRARSAENRRQHRRIAKRVLGRRFMASEPYMADKTLDNRPCDSLKANHVFEPDGPGEYDGLGDEVAMDVLAGYQTIWLYGAGTFGMRVLQLLETQGIAIKGVADSYQTGEWQGYDVLSPDALAAQLSAQDAILIASDHWREIAANLRAEGLTTALFTVRDILFVQNDARPSPIL